MNKKFIISSSIVLGAGLIYSYKNNISYEKVVDKFDENVEVFLEFVEKLVELTLEVLEKIFEFIKELIRKIYFQLKFIINE